MAHRTMMCLIGFVNHLKKKFGTTDNLNKAWFLNYWGEDVNGWENMPTRDNAHQYRLQAGVVALGADAGEGFSRLAG